MPIIQSTADLSSFFAIFFKHGVTSSAPDSEWYFAHLLPWRLDAWFTIRWFIPRTHSCTEYMYCIYHTMHLYIWYISLKCGISPKSIKTVPKIVNIFASFVFNTCCSKKPQKSSHKYRYVVMCSCFFTWRSPCLSHLQHKDQATK